MNIPIHAPHSLDCSDLAAFINQRSRLPRFEDNPPPWCYRGWLLPYIVLLHEKILAVKDRWDYHLRTLKAGKLLDEPIPKIQFGPANERVFKMLEDWSRLIGYDCGGWSDFRTLLDWLCWGLALSSAAPLLGEETNAKLYRQVNLVPLLETPHDYLGDYVARNRARGWNPTGFYPTPHQVVECMVQMTMHDLDRGDKILAQSQWPIRASDQEGCSCTPATSLCTSTVKTSTRSPWRCVKSTAPSMLRGWHFRCPRAF